MLTTTLVMATLAQPVIGGWSAARGGEYALDVGVSTMLCRESIVENLGAAIVSTDVLTPEFAGSVDALMLIVIRDGTHAITPLDADEQEVMIDFVVGGGTLLVFSDNSTFDGANGQVANASLLSPFGLAAVGTGPSVVVADVVQSSVVTDGPFGAVESISLYFPGWFDETGDATVLAEYDSGPVLARFAPGELGEGSAVFFSDASLIGVSFGQDANIETVVLNALSVAVCAADVNGDGALNILDFVAFQVLFQEMDDGADCDGNGVFNILDFVCYQQLFQGGCG